MTTATETLSGKGHTDENFPVASKLIRPENRAPILAFYKFVRAGDDVADNNYTTPDKKIELLDGLAAALTGEGASDPLAEPLKAQLAERNLSPRHALDLLDAFRLDAKKSRYADFLELMAYCSLSAMPVGRFVLDVHKEDPKTTWPPSDAICAALQIINHLQDCGKDYKDLDRVYLPDDIMRKHGARYEDLGADKATPELLAVIRELAGRCEGLLNEGKVLIGAISDTRLALEISAIHRLAVTLTAGLKVRDPLSEKVHFSKAGFAATALASAAGTLLARLFRSAKAGSIWGEAR
jgi:hydroxysqualene synthase